MKAFGLISNCVQSSRTCSGVSNKYISIARYHLCLFVGNLEVHCATLNSTPVWVVRGFPSTAGCKEPRLHFQQQGGGVRSSEVGGLDCGIAFAVAYITVALKSSLGFVRSDDEILNLYLLSIKFYNSGYCCCDNYFFEDIKYPFTIILVYFQRRSKSYCLNSCS